MTNITTQNSTLNFKLVKFNGAEQLAINARDLHKFLECKQDFPTWIKTSIQNFGFVENEDFILEKSFSLNYEKPQPNRDEVVFYNFIENLVNHPTLNYFISLDMAKELAIDDLTKCRILRRKM
mgnify:CR=1 FL=1